MTIVHDPVLTAYVNAVTQRLTASQEAKASGFTFTFQIVANPAINAYALPGGPMFINTGLLKEVANEAQFAGAIAHEMSHVILRHGTNQASKLDLIQLPVALAGQLTNSDTLMGQLAQLGIGLGADSVLLKFNRIHESQADLMGSHIMAEAGYDPIQLARFFVRLNDQSGAFVFLSDHPNPGDRSRAIKEEAAQLPHRTYGYQTGHFQEMKRAVANIHEPPRRRCRRKTTPALPGRQSIEAGKRYTSITCNHDRRKAIIFVTQWGYCPDRLPARLRIDLRPGRSPTSARPEIAGSIEPSVASGNHSATGNTRAAGQASCS